MRTMVTIDTIGQNGPLQVRGTYGRRLFVAVKTLAARLAWWVERRRSRLALLELSDYQLKDIGLSRADAYREGARPFWD